MAAFGLVAGLFVGCAGGDVDEQGAAPPETTTPETTAAQRSDEQEASADSQEEPVAETDPPATTEPVDETTTTTESSTTTTEPLPIDFGQQYLDAVAPVNCAAVAANDAFNEVADAAGFIYDEQWPIIAQVVLPAYRAYSEALTEFAAALINADWPAEVIDDINTLVAEVTQDAAGAYAVSEARNTAEWSQAMDRFSGGSTAGIVRARLGLPTNLGLDIVCD